MTKQKTFSLDQLEKQKSRENAMAQGAYDGRFRPRIVKDKKKEQSKKGAKNWKAWA